ncbi:hypothetical protein PENTCL1PPCAC_5705, partial [Pristionchus entomophagus]
YDQGDIVRERYLERATFQFTSSSAYRSFVLPALLLGCRVRDFEQRCAEVISSSPLLILTMPSPAFRGRTVKLRTVDGETFEATVKSVQKQEKRWQVTCHPTDEPLDDFIFPDDQLEILFTTTAVPRVTEALMRKYERQSEAIGNWRLLETIYGKSIATDFPKSAPANQLIRLAKNAGTLRLNAEQAQAIGLYNCSTCPAFVVESPPGSGKTLTAAAMALAYNGSGAQLFLSTANVPVINMALAFSRLDYGNLKAIHFISSEREDQVTEDTRSPFSVLSLAKAHPYLNEEICQLEEEIDNEPDNEKRAELRRKIHRLCRPIFDAHYDVFLATVDSILGRLVRVNAGNYVDVIKNQLTTNVKRIVVDEASQLTEAALNALILSFPQAQIVLIGDEKQLPPFKYEPGDVVSELASRSALDVMKDKGNLPVIRLKHVYRASPSLVAHYSNVFYGGCLVSCKPESTTNPLTCFGALRGSNARCLFWKVRKGPAKPSGTSLYNDGELTALKNIIETLRKSNFDEKSVMIICYYDAQRKRAEAALPHGYEVLTVDSAQGREKRIVIVLTTATSMPREKGSFLICPLRCNVSVSRHQEALIVIGHPSIASAPNWAKVLSPKYFKVV